MLDSFIMMQFYNKVEMVPTNIVAILFGFKKQNFFEIIEEDLQVAKFKF